MSFDIKLRLSTFSFVGSRRIFYAFSILLLLIAFGFVCVKGVPFGIDFNGGINLEVSLKKGKTIADIREILSNENLQSFSVHAVGNHELIRVYPSHGEDFSVASLRVHRALSGVVSEFLREDIVGPVIGKEFFFSSLWAILLSILMIFVYIWYRFDLYFSTAAMIALVHDLLFCYGCYAIFDMDFSLSSVAALLTIAGYSINDTVVVYDSVRGVFSEERSAESLINYFDSSIKRVWRRTFRTSVTTFFAVLALFVFGGDTLRSFAFVFGVGLILGTYSSVCVALPLVYTLKSLRR